MSDRRKILGITTKKDQNFYDWYLQVINKAELIESIPPVYTYYVAEQFLKDRCAVCGINEIYQYSECYDCHLNSCDICI